MSPFAGRSKLPWNLQWCAQWDYFDVLKLTSTTEAETAKSFGAREEIGCTMGAL
jgi:lysyl-tRNA synthetase class I